MVMCKRTPDPGFQSIQEMISTFFHPPGWAKEYLLRADEAYQPYTPLCRGENATATDLWECYDRMHEQNPLFRGLYADQLERWFRVYNRSQVLILDSAKMFANFTTAVERVAEFAGLPAHDFQYESNHVFRGVCKKRQHSHGPEFFAEGGLYESMLAEEAIFREWYRPHNERLFHLLGYDFGWDF